MKLAITGTLSAGEYAPLVFRGPYEEIIPKASQIGFDSMELHIHDSSKLDRAKLKKLLKENNMGLSSIGTGSAYSQDHISLSSEEEPVRQAAVRRIQDHIITAKDYGAVVIIGLIKGLVRDCSSPDVFQENLIHSLQECLTIAEQNKVVLVLELINRYESDCLNTIAEGLEFLKKFDTEYLKLHIDTYHMNIEETHITDNICRAAGKIGHCHLADSDRWYVGHGHYDFQATVDALRKIGYDRALSVESYYFPEPEISARYSMEQMKKL